MSRNSGEKYKDKWQQNAATHPVYGIGPSEATGHGDTEISKKQCMVNSGSAFIRFFPATAIPAEQSFQGNTQFPKSYYVDQLIRCSGCKRCFVYFADEHKFRVEEKGRNFQAIPSHCYDCRKLHGELKRAKQELDQLLWHLKAGDRKNDEQSTLSSEQWLRLGENFLLLVENKRLPNSSSFGKLRARIINLADDRLPELSDIAKRLSDKSK